MQTYETSLSWYCCQEHYINYSYCCPVILAFTVAENIYIPLDTPYNYFRGIRTRGRMAKGMIDRCQEGRCCSSVRKSWHLQEFYSLQERILGDIRTGDFIPGYDLVLAF